MSGLTLNEYQDQAMTFAMYQDETYPLLGLAEETGELLGVFAKIARGDQIEGLNDRVKKEAGDVLWMLTAILTESRMSLEEVAEANITKLTDRKLRNKIQGEGDNR